MHKNTKCILGNPSQQGKKTQQNPLLYFSREDLYHQEYPSTQEGAQNPRTLAPKRGAQLLPRSVLAEISKTHKCVCVYNEIFPFTYIRLVLSTEVSIGTTGPTSLRYIIYYYNN
jgi:hypothetical protein